MYEQYARLLFFLGVKTNIQEAGKPATSRRSPIVYHQLAVAGAESSGSNGDKQHSRQCPSRGYDGVCGGYEFGKLLRQSGQNHWEAIVTNSTADSVPVANTTGWLLGRSVIPSTTLFL